MDSTGFEGTLSLHYSILENTSLDLSKFGNDEAMDIDTGTGSLSPTSKTLSRDSPVHRSSQKVHEEERRAACYINDEEFYTPREVVTHGNPLDENMDGDVAKVGYMSPQGNISLESPFSQSCFSASMIPETPNVLPSIGQAFPNKTFFSLLDSQIEESTISKADVSESLPAQQCDQSMDDVGVDKSQGQVVSPNGTQQALSLGSRGKRKRMDGDQDDLFGIQLRRSKRSRRGSLDNSQSGMTPLASSTPKDRIGKKKKSIEKHSPIEMAEGNSHKSQLKNETPGLKVKYIVNTPAAPSKIKIRKAKLKDERQPLNTANEAAITPISTHSVPPKVKIRNLITEEEKVKLAALKITLKRLPPLNPLDKSSGKYFKKGMLNPRNHASAQLYLTGTLNPRIIQIKSYDSVQEKIEDCLELERHYGPVDMDNVKESMKMEAMLEHNAVANYRSHGKVALEGTNFKITRDKTAVRGAIPKINLDNNYEQLLKVQDSFASNFGNRAIRTAKFDSTLANLFNSADESQVEYPDGDQSLPERRKRRKILHQNDLIGVVPVDDCDFECEKNRDFFSKRVVFDFKGQLYRLNPAVILIQKTPDELIERMKAPPEKITFQSAYYSALTSYFDKREAKILGN